MFREFLIAELVVRFLQLLLCKADKKELHHWNSSCFEMIEDVHIFVFNSPFAKPGNSLGVASFYCCALMHDIFPFTVTSRWTFSFNFTTASQLLFFLCNFLVVSFDNVIYILYQLQLMYFVNNETSLSTKPTSHSQINCSF